MELMRAADVPQTERDLVFRSSRLYALLFVGACVGTCALLIYFHWPQPRIAYIISGIILLLIVLLHRLVTARFHPLNWLVRMGDEGLYIHFRSYLNEALSADDPTVVFLSFRDIHSARLVHEHLQTRSAEGGTETQFLKWIELELTIDPAPLASALATERARPGVTEKRWYGTSATLYQDYPVLMQKPPFLRVAWRVVPGASVLLNAMRQRIEIAPEVTVRENFSNLDALTPEQQEKRLRELNQRGQTIAAIYLARKLYGCDLTEAKRYIEGLQGESRP
jgi:hypothetical protein